MEHGPQCAAERVVDGEQRRAGGDSELVECGERPTPAAAETGADRTARLRPGVCVVHDIMIGRRQILARYRERSLSHTGSVFRVGKG